MEDGVVVVATVVSSERGFMSSERFVALKFVELVAVLFGELMLSGEEGFDEFAEGEVVLEEAEDDGVVEAFEFIVSVEFEGAVVVVVVVVAAPLAVLPEVAAVSEDELGYACSLPVDGTFIVFKVESSDATPSG